jgi:hypothetical protein
MRGDSAIKEQGSEYPAKSSRRGASERGSAKSRSSADHLSVARALIEQKNLHAAREHLELAVALGKQRDRLILE